ncbi:helix-turn-helix domain-containing protein [Dysgonomonas capnocytophagoides]|uniref:helix-turn-helix domain-containing protein n=1 Tax=Dysgonomonas capnocytophagoides TaxID=45254 RepID=UPI003991F7C6
MEKTLLDGRQLSEEEFKKKINKYRVYTDINLVMASDKISTTLLFLLQHLTNLDNLCVSQSFLAKHLGCNERTIRRKLNKLKELGIVTWESGAKKHRMNDYSINQEKYDVLIATINTLSFEDRLIFINKLFEEKTPKKKENKKSIEMNPSIEGEQSAIVKTNYSVLSEEKKGSIDYSISECVAQCMNIVGSEMTPDTVNVFNRAWEHGVTLCDDFAEQLKSYLIKMEQPQRVFDTLNGLVNKNIEYNQISTTV